MEFNQTGQKIWLRKIIFFIQTNFFRLNKIKKGKKTISQSTARNKLVKMHLREFVLNILFDVAVSYLLLCKKKRLHSTEKIGSCCLSFIYFEYLTFAC